MNKNNDFYEFTQDLEIDFSNKPNKFIDLESLINQLTDILNKSGNTRCAIITDRHTKFTYLYSFAGDGSIITDILYPHKGKSLTTQVRHVFVPNDEVAWNEKHECDAFKTSLVIDPLKQHLYVDAKCLGDDGQEYDIDIIDNTVYILFHDGCVDRYINMKITITMISDEELVIDSFDPKNKLYAPNPDGVCETIVNNLIRNGTIKCDADTISTSQTQRDTFSASRSIFPPVERKVYNV